MEPPALKVSTARLCLAIVALIVLLIVVWKFIDYRMQPPPPPNPVTADAPR